MASKSIAFADDIRDQTFSGTAATAPTTWFVALMKTAPDMSGTPTIGAECDYTGYGRLEVKGYGDSSGDQEWVKSGDYASTIATDMLFGTNTSGSTQAVVAVAVFKTATIDLANLLHFKTITSYDVADTQNPKIAASTLTITEG